MARGVILPLALSSALAVLCVAEARAQAPNAGAPAAAGPVVLEWERVGARLALPPGWKDTSAGAMQWRSGASADAACQVSLQRRRAGAVAAGAIPAAADALLDAEVQAAREDFAKNFPEQRWEVVRRGALAHEPSRGRFFDVRGSDPARDKDGTPSAWRRLRAYVRRPADVIEVEVNGEDATWRPAEVEALLRGLSASAEFPGVDAAARARFGPAAVTFTAAWRRKGATEPGAAAASETTRADASGPRIELQVARGHMGRVEAVAVLPDGRRLLSGSSDDWSLRLWDLASGEQLREWALTPSEKIRVSPDGRLAATTGGGYVNVVNLETGRKRAGFLAFWQPDTIAGTKVQSGFADHLEWSPDGAWLAAAATFPEAALHVYPRDFAARIGPAGSAGGPDEPREAVPPPPFAIAASLRQGGAAAAAEGEDDSDDTQDPYANAFGATQPVPALALLATFEGWLPDGRLVVGPIEPRFQGDTSGPQGREAIDLRTGARSPAPPAKVKAEAPPAGGDECEPISTSPPVSLPGGALEVLGLSDGSLQVRERAGGREVERLGRVSALLPRAVQPSEDGRACRVLAGDRVLTFEVATGRLLSSVSAPADVDGAASEWSAARRGSGLPEAARAAWTPPDDPAEGIDLAGLSGYEDEFLGQSPTDFEVLGRAAAPARGLLATIHRDGAVRVWSLLEGEPVAEAGGRYAHRREHQGWVALRRDGALLAASKPGNLLTLRPVALDAGGVGHRSFHAGLELAGHGSSILDGAFSADGSLLFTASDDRTVGVWRVETAELLYRWVTDDRGQWVAFAPDGIYAASREAGRLLHFVVDGAVYPFEQFDLARNRPDLLWARVGLATPGLVSAARDAVERRARRMGLAVPSLEGAVASAAPPRVALDRGQVPVATSATAITLEARAEVATSTAAPLARWQVHVNDVPLWGRRGLPVSEAGARTAARRLDVPLGHGANKVQVSVVDERGVESRRETVRVVRTGPEPRRALRIFAAGVSEYRDPALRLAYAAKDAREVAAGFADAGRALGLTVAEPRVLTDGAVTREALQAWRAELLRTAVDDHVVVFLAGHGLLGADQGYLFATADIDAASPAGRAVPYEAIEDLLDAIPARRKVLLMDTCHSGEVDPDEAARLVAAAPGVKTRAVRGFGPALSGSKVARGEDRELLRELFADLRRGTGAIVLSSAAGVEVAFESERWKNGAFTYAVLEAMRAKGTDSNGDGRVSVMELREAAARRVRELTRGAQSPSARAENLAGDFPLGEAAK